MTPITAVTVTYEGTFTEITELPEFIPCKLHGDFNWRCYYSDDEMLEMIEAGDIDCPLCLWEIVGIEGL